VCTSRALSLVPTATRLYILCELAADEKNSVVTPTRARAGRGEGVNAKKKKSLQKM